MPESSVKRLPFTGDLVDDATSRALASADPYVAARCDRQASSPVAHHLSDMRRDQSSGHTVNKRHVAELGHIWIKAAALRATAPGASSATLCLGARSRGPAGRSAEFPT